MKRSFIAVFFSVFSFVAQSQITEIQYGFAAAKYGYDYFSSTDADAYIELVVFTPNNDTLKTAVGSNLNVFNGSAQVGVHFDMPTSATYLFPVGTTIFNGSNRMKIKINPKIDPDGKFWGRRDFALTLTQFQGILPAQSLYLQRDTLYIYLDYDGSNIGLPKISVSDYRLYPNPATDKVTIEGPQMLNYKVFDMAGRVVLEASHAANNEVHIAELPKGLYILKSETSKGLLLHKLVKE